MLKILGVKGDDVDQSIRVKLGSFRDQLVVVFGDADNPEGTVEITNDTVTLYDNDGCITFTTAQDATVGEYNRSMQRN